MNVPRGIRRASRVGGWPVRVLLVLLIRLYRLTIGRLWGGSCRFYPSCSVYAEVAITELGWVRGVPLGMWRVIRCSPLSRGGVDYPPGVPADRVRRYDSAIQRDDPVVEPVATRRAR